MKWQHISNFPVAILLRSPLHALISDSVLFITVTGSKSGRRYSTPVDYVRVPGSDDLLIVSKRCRTWWRNLMGGSPLEILTERKRVHASGVVIVAQHRDQVTEGLLTVCRQIPGYRKHAGTSSDEDGNPTDPAQLERLSQSSVVVRLSNIVEGVFAGDQTHDRHHGEAAASDRALVP